MAGKKPKIKNKKIFYRRATWDKSFTGKKSIEIILRESHFATSTVAQRTFVGKLGSEIVGADFEDNMGMYLHIAVYVPDEPTSTIDKKSSTKKSKVKTLDAPVGQNFLSGDVFVFVKGDHLVLCPSGVREAVVHDYLYHLLVKVGLPEVAEALELEKVAKISALKIIRDEGVKSIELNASLYEATMIHMDPSKPSPVGITRTLADQMASMFSKDKTLKEITDKENLNVKISLSFDGREARSKYNSRDIEFGVAGKKRLIETAAKIVDDFDDDDDSLPEDGFTIVTRQGTKITPDEIRVSGDYKIKTFGKSLDKENAWVALKSFYENLKSNGMLNQ